MTKEKLRTFRIERVDVSWCEVEAASEQEALDFADNNPQIWEFEAGELTVEEEE